MKDKSIFNIKLVKSLTPILHSKLQMIYHDNKMEDYETVSLTN